MSKPIRVALIGCGTWGRNILRGLVALGCDVIVVDPSSDAAQRARGLGAAGVLAGTGALPAVDGVVIASPASRHVACIDAVLDREVPIFCEKPLCLRIGDGERLARSAGDRLFEMHVWRYHPGIEKIAALLRAGDLGDPQWLRSTRVNWASPRLDVDPIWTLAPHDLSIALEILGELPQPRAAVAERVGRGLGAEQTRAVGLVGILAGPTPFVFEVSTRHARKRREVRLHGTLAVAALCDDHLTLARGTGDDGAIELPLESAEEPLRRELRCFLDFLRGGLPPRSSMADSLAVLSAMTQLRELAGLDP